MMLLYVDVDDVDVDDVVVCWCDVMYDGDVIFNLQAQSRAQQENIMRERALLQQKENMLNLQVLPFALSPS